MLCLKVELITRDRAKTLIRDVSVGLSAIAKTKVRRFGCLRQLKINTRCLCTAAEKIGEILHSSARLPVPGVKVIAEHPVPWPICAAQLTSTKHSSLVFRLGWARAGYGRCSSTASRRALSFQYLDEPSWCSVSGSVGFVDLKSQMLTMEWLVVFK